MILPQATSCHLFHKQNPCLCAFSTGICKPRILPALAGHTCAVGPIPCVSSRADAHWWETCRAIEAAKTRGINSHWRHLLFCSASGKHYVSVFELGSTATTEGMCLKLLCISLQQQILKSHWPWNWHPGFTAFTDLQRWLDPGTTEQDTRKQIKASRGSHQSPSAYLTPWQKGLVNGWFIFSTNKARSGIPWSLCFPPPKHAEGTWKEFMLRQTILSWGN